MIVTATEFKTNLGKYFELAVTQVFLSPKMEKILPGLPVHQ